MNEVHDLYQQLIGKSNENAVCESSNRHMLNFNHLRNLKKIEIDSFRMYYVVAYRILAPKLQGMWHWIFVKELGGHIEVKEEGYAKVEREFHAEVDNVLRHYNHIKSLEKYIANEFRMMEKEITSKVKNDYLFKQATENPGRVISGEQLSLF